MARTILLEQAKNAKQNGFPSRNNFGTYDFGPLMVHFLWNIPVRISVRFSFSEREWMFDFSSKQISVHKFTSTSMKKS